MIKLKRSFHDGNNRPIVYLEGNTYPLRQRLGKRGLGFNWYGKRKIWWMYENKFNNLILNKLKDLDVDVSEYSLSSDKMEERENIEERRDERSKESLTDKTKVDEKAPSPRYYGFNIASNIYSFEDSFKVDDQQYSFKVVVDRSYKKGVRKVPFYRMNLFYEETPIGGYAVRAPGPWGSYDEDDFVKELPQKIQEGFNKKRSSKTYRLFKAELALRERDPEFSQFLETWEKNKYNDDFDLQNYIYEHLPERFVELDTQEISGRFPIGFYLIVGNLHLRTKVDHPLAPEPKLIGHISIYPEISSLEEMNNIIDEYIQNNSDEIKQKYLKYLSSFAYTEEQEQESRQEMEEIVNFIGKNYDINFFMNKMIQYGYVRPSKKTKREDIGEGMKPQGQIKMVIDDKKIRDAVYARDASNTPDYFYAVLAYYLLRKVRNISSWTDMALVSNINSWVHLATRYNKDIDFSDVSSYLEKLANGLHRELTGKDPRKGRWEQYEDFYSGKWWTGEEQKDVSTGPSKALRNFAEYASKLGADFEQAISHPKSIYRQLAIKFHPDVAHEDEKKETEKIFGKLAELYNLIPNEQKMAKTWFRKVQIFS